MSYGFQLGGVIKGGVAGTFDYSRSALGSLNENSLSEPVGVGAPRPRRCGGQDSPCIMPN
jgi:hypothetical protein